jgi:hypothetical protein
MTQDLPKRHHWWPEGVSGFWVNNTGGIHRLQPDGDVKSLTPRNIGVIGGGHWIKLGDKGEPTPWDQSFESEFERADAMFPDVIRWLDSLDRRGPPFEIPRSRRMMTQPITDDQMGDVIECLVSLAVRSPMHRERAVSLAEDLRGPLPERERNSLIGLNMRDSMKRALGSLRGSGKVMVVYSPEREFIYGDGFFHNITPPCDIINNAKIVAPLTPWMTVIYARPSRFRTDPRLVTITATIAEAETMNRAVQIYARRQLFYRSEAPTITDAFRQEKHLIFRDDQNPIDGMIYDIPGISPRDASLDFLLDR